MAINKNMVKSVVYILWMAKSSKFNYLGSDVKNGKCDCLFFVHKYISLIDCLFSCSFAVYLYVILQRTQGELKKLIKNIKNA